MSFGADGGRRHRDLLSCLILAPTIVITALIPVLFNSQFYFYADTPEGAYGQWFELGEQVRQGVWPMMNPSAWMAGNYIAEGQWGLWNPIVLLIGVWVSLSSNALLVSTAVKILFLVIGGTGVYAVARSFGARPGWAFVAGLAAPLAGFTLYMDATSWVTNEMVWAFSAWTIWAIREYLHRGRSILWPTVAGYLLVSVGYLQGTLVLIFFYLALIIDQAVRRQWRTLGRTFLIGVIHGLFALTVFLPGVLTSSVTTRAQEVTNTGFMVLPLSGLATANVGFSTGSLVGWWGSYANLPLLYVAWFLPLMCLVSWRRVPILANRTSQLLLFGGIVLLQATAPSDMGPMRFPSRSLPWLAMVLIVCTVLVMDRYRDPRPSSRRLVAMFGCVLLATWLVFAATPQWWNWPRNGSHIVLYAIGFVAVWAGARGLVNRLSPGWAQRLAMPLVVVLITVIVVPLQAKTFAPLVQSRSDYPEQAAVYEDVLPSGHGEGIIVGDALSLPEDFWSETVFGNSWYLLNRVQIQNLYTPVGYDSYSRDLCLLYDGRTCEALLAKLFQTDPTTGMRLVDLLSIDSVQILATPDRPIEQLERRAVPQGWQVSERTEQSVVWTREQAGTPVGEVVWASEGLSVVQGANTNTSSTFHVDQVGPDGGTVVLSRLDWPGYQVAGGTLADPLRDYLLTVTVPPDAAGTDITVTFRPPGWHIEVAAVAVGWLLAVGLTMVGWWRRRQRQAPSTVAISAERVEGTRIQIDQLLDQQPVHRVSVVIPVYKGEQTLPQLVAEIAPLTSPTTTPDGHTFQVDLIYPVWDNGPDRSDVAIHQLAEQYDFVRPVWLSRNFGQHPATMAGMASTSSDWIVTMDEDGQHDPADIALLLDTALREHATVVYAKPTNPPPHGPFRNWASRTAKNFLAKVMGSTHAPEFHSFRLVLGETGRALAAYAGPGVYLDVALGWIARKITTCDVEMRVEDRPSGYSTKTLVSHFLRMIVTSGTRGLRLVTFTGVAVGVVGLVWALVLIVLGFVSPVPVQGWTSTMVVLLLGTGLTLSALGIVAEYIGVTVNVAMGKPLYLIVSDPANGPMRHAFRPASPAINPAADAPAVGPGPATPQTDAAQPGTQDARPKAAQ